MGNWNITIRGTGCHHNNGLDTDANRMAAEFVAKLRAAGHSIASATITFGGEDILTEPLKYLDDRDAGEESSARQFAPIVRKPRCHHPVGSEACRLVENHEGDHLPPVKWTRYRGAT